MLLASCSHILVVFFIVAFTIESQITGGVGLTLSQTFLDALRYTESGGDVCALGDSGRSLGAYRIKREHYTDAVLVNGTLTANGEEYEDLWGEGSIPYSEKVLAVYVNNYATYSRLGHVPMYEDLARIHNGGPDGWNDSSTLDYWRRVHEAMNSRSTAPNGINTDRCDPQCESHQCCDRDEEGNYKCFCLQAKVNNHKEYVKRPCENCSEIAGIDVVFVLDSSGSIGNTNFQKVRDFVNAVVNDLEIGPTRTQVGVIVFSSSAAVSFSLNTYSNRAALSSAVNSIPYIGKGTDTAGALYLLINQGFVGARPKIQGVPRIAIVVTDGQSNQPPLTAIAAKALRNVSSITTYAVGIGSVNKTELKIIATNENLVRHISSFDLVELERLQQDLQNQACTASTVIDVEATPIHRQIQQEIKVYLEFSVPEEGFTVKVELEVGRVAVCGSNSLERPDCSYNLTYDWKLVVNAYKEVFIGPDGYPASASNTKKVPKYQTMNITNETLSIVDTNNTVYVTIEGLDADNIFFLNTTYGDTTTLKPHTSVTTVTPPLEVGNLDSYIIIAISGGGAVLLLLLCLVSVCIICGMCFCTRSRKTLHPYQRLKITASDAVPV